MKTKMMLKMVVTALGLFIANRVDGACSNYNTIGVSSRLESPQFSGKVVSITQRAPRILTNPVMTAISGLGINFDSVVVDGQTYTCAQFWVSTERSLDTIESSVVMLDQLQKMIFQAMALNYTVSGYIQSVGSSYIRFDQYYGITLRK